ncbi:uncharacterized protein FIBRA_02212 [Fibroporia radiculosa]|uniref:Uncharacterized protein n=1 Tax=Fibroporia radiculosa TaxID=599839 RepID=J4H1Q5_9APHY|nr:uncharacterized protein FIBRA_02212 [Fibroporia radiculosa]CCM00184.1 predicted protein [Fibroporia radiculosa]
MAFDDFTPERLLSEVASRLPGLEALHVVILLAPYSVQTLLRSGSVLSKFSGLRYITVIVSESDAPIGDDHGIASAWHKFCPTLKTIVLPGGQLWIEREGQWFCSACT